MMMGLCFLPAAKSQGCGVQIQPGDGSAATWDGGVVPSPNAHPSAMTCEWLDENNCWKRLVTKAQACAVGVTGGQGHFTDDRRSCTYPNGSSWQLEGPIDTPSDGTILFPVVNWRLLDPNGAPCMTGKVLGPGRTTFDVQGEVALFENITLTKYQVTCPDGKTYVNDNVSSSNTRAPAPADAGDRGDAGDAGDAGAIDGSASDPELDASAAAPASEEDPSGSQVCPSFGLSWLAHRAPGVLMACNGTDRQCTLGLWGGLGGEVTGATCNW